jgi:hypothetical protein
MIKKGVRFVYAQRWSIGAMMYQPFKTVVLALNLPILSPADFPQFPQLNDPLNGDKVMIENTDAAYICLNFNDPNPVWHKLVKVDE